jgi:hypothetical protein
MARNISSKHSAKHDEHDSRKKRLLDELLVSANPWSILRATATAAAAAADELSGYVNLTAEHGTADSQ